MGLKKFWLTIGLLGGLAAPVQAQTPNWQLYDQLLQRHLERMTVQGIELSWVDYSAIRQDAEFEQLLQQLDRFNPEQLSSRPEQLAFYINAYNILAINLVQQHWPLGSIKDAAPWYRSVWKQPAGTIGGEAVSLDHIEHQILRPMGEPRIHFAIVCASLSCPDLRAEAYTAGRLEQQLEDQTRGFINNADKGVRLTAQGVRISKIFDWFADDFGGESALPGWISSYRMVPITTIDGYLKYNWAVNGD